MSHHTAVNTVQMMNDVIWSKGDNYKNNKCINNKGITKDAFLYCCSDCPSYTPNVLQMDLATWAIWTGKNIAYVMRLRVLTERDTPNVT